MGDSPVGFHSTSSGSSHRQLVVRHRIPAMDVAIDHRDRRAPVTLAGDQPVAVAIVDRLLADALLLQLVDDHA